MRKNNVLKVLRKIAPWVLVTFFMFSPMAMPSAKASFGIVVTIAPAPLPVYVQPVCPGPGFIWVPGYWAWNGDGYFWVPGTWVFAPFPGALWTPGYWAWDPDDGGYVWYEGYWGPVVGFYGGINYGYGYTGYGYEGGYWRNGAFYYNRSVNNVSTTNITNVYNKTVVNNVTVNNVSYNGGQGGIAARPTPEQIAAGRERRTGPTAEQGRQVQVARADPTLRFSANHGRPPVAATVKPGELRGQGAVRATGAGEPAGQPKGEAQPGGGFHPAQPKPHETQKAPPQSNGNWHQFSQPNSKQTEKPAPPMKRPAPEAQAPATRPQRQGKMQPQTPQRPATREAQQPVNRPQNPEKPAKPERREPPPGRGR